MSSLVSNSAAREILNGNWIARLYKFRERVARPCYRLSRLSSSPRLRSPRELSVQNVTSGRWPLSRRMLLVGLASRPRMRTTICDRARVHIFRGLTRALCLKPFLRNYYLAN